MGKFDFLNKIGESKNDYKAIDIEKDVKDKRKYLEITSTRNLIQNEFKDELIAYYLNKKINEAKFYENVQKSISVLEKAEFKIISIDGDIFKLKNNKPEYVGVIDRMSNDQTKLSKNRGKVSYSFAIELYEHLKDKIITLKEINDLSDLLDFKILTIFNFEQTKVPSE